MNLNWKRKRVEREPWLRFHWQNLNEKPGDKYGSPLKHGRAWLHLGKGEINWCWHLNPRACALGVKVGEGHYDGVGLHFHVGIPLIGSLFVGFSDFAPLSWLAKALLPKVAEPRGLHGYNNTRETEVRVHDGALWWSVWRHPNAGWSCEVPRWRDGNFNFVDALLGKAKSSGEVLKERDIVVPMPEGFYLGKAKLELRTWKRPRWFAKRWLRVDIDMNEGQRIPIPGKGENSWDCDDDACFGSSVSAKSIEEAIGKLVGDCLKTRRERGGPENWNDRGRERGAA